MTVDPTLEQTWLEEAQRRYDAFLKGELEARLGDDVMARARNRLTVSRETETGELPAHSEPPFL